MLKEIRDELLNDIKTALPELGTIGKYRGEFEEGSDWKPTDTACFVRVTGYRPRVKASDNSILKKTVEMKIYAGANSRHFKDALDIVESLVDLFSGSSITVSGTKFNFVIPDEGMDLILYERGFEAYAFIILIQ